MPTMIPYGDPRAAKIYSAALFAQHMQRHTVMSRLVGPVPNEATAGKILRWQNDSSMPIVQCMDLTRSAGDEIFLDLIKPVGGKPVMGERFAEGTGDAMSFATIGIRIDQYRKPISAGGKMTQQRTSHELRKLARDQADGYMKRLEDMLRLVHLAGARGDADPVGALWGVPLDTDPEFSDIVVNPVRTPTWNRHYVSTGAGIVQAADSTSGYAAGALTSADVMNLDVIDNLRKMLDDMAFPPPPVQLPGDVAAQDDPMYLLLVSAPQYESIKTADSAKFRTFQAAAQARSSQAGNHPLFRGEVGLWNGILVKKMSRPIRFNAGTAVKYWPTASRFTSALAEGSMSTRVVGSSTTVDRALLIGGQALAEAYGKNRNTGNPYFWSEKELDHGDKLEVLIGAIGAKSKVRFRLDNGAGEEDTDYSVIAIDTYANV